MERVEYTVKNIAGDYAILVTANGIENTVALFFLPLEIQIGSKVIYENLEYTMG